MAAITKFRSATQQLPDGGGTAELEWDFTVTGSYTAEIACPTISSSQFVYSLTGKISVLFFLTLTYVLTVTDTIGTDVKNCTVLVGSNSPMLTPVLSETHVGNLVTLTTQPYELYRDFIFTEQINGAVTDQPFFIGKFVFKAYLDNQILFRLNNLSNVDYDFVKVKFIFAGSFEAFTIEVDFIANIFRITKSGTNLASMDISTIASVAGDYSFNFQNQYSTSLIVGASGIPFSVQATITPPLQFDAYEVTTVPKVAGSNTLNMSLVYTNYTQASYARFELRYVGGSFNEIGLNQNFVLPFSVSNNIPYTFRSRVTVV